MTGDLVVTLDMARLLRRVRNAGCPLSRHDLYHGTTGCSASDVQACLAHGLVIEVQNPKTSARRSFPLIALTQLGLNVLRVFRFPAPGRKAVPKQAYGSSFQWGPDASEYFAAPGTDSDAGAYLSDLVRRCQRGETLVVD